MPATVLFLECKSYVIVGIYTSISEFPLMCGDVRFSGTPHAACTVSVQACLHIATFFLFMTQTEQNKTWNPPITVIVIIITMWCTLTAELETCHTVNPQRSKGHAWQTIKYNITHWLHLNFNRSTYHINNVKFNLKLNRTINKINALYDKITCKVVNTTTVNSNTTPCQIMSNESILFRHLKLVNK